MAHGFKQTTIDGIARELHVSKKTIYLVFRTKEDLLVESFKWKLDQMASHSASIIKDDLSLVDKLLRLLKTIHIELKDVSISGIKSTFQFKDKMKGILEEYLKGAVFERFRLLIDSGVQEGLIQSKVDVNTMMLMYWETLSSFIFVRPAGKPIESIISRPFNQHLNLQLINFFRGFLNERGIKLFDAALENDDVLSDYYA